MKKGLLPVKSICGKEKKISGKEALVKLLRWHFGHSEYRKKQLEAIEAVLSMRLLYVTPELIATTGFMAKLTKLHARGLLNPIAIDEAHCISTWGNDFRPSYRKLASLRKRLSDIPMLALTATSVPKVQVEKGCNDAIEFLKLITVLAKMLKEL